jgi:hypothetical protein
VPARELAGNIERFAHANVGAAPGEEPRSVQQFSGGVR